MHPRRSQLRRGAFVGATAFAWVLVSGCSVEMEDSATQEASALGYDSALGNRVASSAARVDGRASGNMCLKGVGDSLDAAGIRPLFPRLPAAVNFDDWARANPGELAKRGYQQQNLSIDSIPRGSIITWRPGQCGYSSQYGHIEITIGGGRACSDYCGNIARGCGAPGIFVPVGDGTSSGGVPSSGGDSCAVRSGEGKLYCTNRTSSVYRDPRSSSSVVDTLRTTNSWFSCWTTGDMHAGGNTTWYRTQGDVHGNWGFVPAAALDTTSAFDADPTARGLPNCGGGSTAASSTSSSCAVQSDGKLHCTNRASSVYGAPRSSSSVVDRLRTTNSWFTCWTTGERHGGGNTTWYGTVGDDSDRFGYVPASALDTTNAFDLNPAGLQRCN